MTVPFLIIFTAGFVSGCVVCFVYAHWSGVTTKPNPQDPGATVVAVIAAIQTQIDRLTPVPAAIAQAIANAEADSKAAAAEAQQAAQDATDSAAALSAAVDPIIAAVTPPAQTTES